MAKILLLSKLKLKTRIDKIYYLRKAVLQIISIPNAKQ